MISKKRKSYLQSIGYEVVRHGGHTLPFAPDGSEPYFDSEPPESEAEAWKILSRDARRKVALLAVITDEKGELFGVSVLTAPACTMYDPCLVAYRVADDIDQVRMANGMSYRIMDSYGGFSPSKKLIDDIYVNSSKKVTITGYNMVEVSYDVEE